ncbi:MAG: PorT family protein [Acidobacteria bacterium]|nr:PorT family protein [Acidobacteriota bacterium]
MTQSKVLFPIVLVLLTSVSAFPQSVSVGVKGGVPISDVFGIASARESYQSHAKRYTVGPFVEIGLPLGLAVEFDALYKRLGYSLEAGQAGFTLSERTHANSWEFPLLLKKGFRSGSARPYVSGGPTFSHLSGLRQLGQLFDPFLNKTTLIDTDRPSELDRRTNTGFAVAAGIDLRAPFLRVSPELRYTRWGFETFQDGISGGGIFHFNRNQFEFLLGISF